MHRRGKVMEVVMLLLMRGDDDNAGDDKQNHDNDDEASQEWDMTARKDVPAVQAAIVDNKNLSGRRSTLNSTGKSRSTVFLLHA